MNGIDEIGCCGAYCKTCREYQDTCKGCKPGYLDGSRDLRRGSVVLSAPWGTICPFLLRINGVLHTVCPITPIYSEPRMGHGLGQAETASSKKPRTGWG